MRRIRTIAAAAASTGLLALGGLAASTGAADAATARPVASCMAGSGTLVPGVTPSCTSTGSVPFPTSIVIDVNSDGSLTPVLGTILQVLGGISVTYSGSCVVNGSARGFSGSFQVTKTTQPTSTTLKLQGLVGAQVPDSCTISVTVSTMKPIPAITLLPAFNLMATVTATTATEG